jgi:phosphatidylinositol alpha-1,6-mannosyltransferase
VKAVLVTTDFPPAIGGIQEALHQMSLHFSRIEISVVTPGAAGASEFDGGLPFPVHRVGPSWQGGPSAHLYPLGRLTAAVLFHIRAEHPDLVICGHPFVSPIGLAARKLLGIPYAVLTYGRELLHRPEILGTCLRRADLVLAISAHTQAMVVSLGVDHSRIRVVPLGVDTTMNKESLPKQPGAGPTMLTISRMDEHYKGHDIVLRALPLMAAKVPKLRWRVVGDGQLRAYYEALAVSLGVADRVHFTGQISRAGRDAYLAACDLFVMLSRDRAIDGGGEGFGLVYLEANLFGKAVVAGRAGGACDAVVDGVTGRLVDPENLLEVAETIVEMLRDPDSTAQMGRRGRDRVLSEFTWQLASGKIEEALLGF